ncbi:sulfatase [Candidatus Hydrogenedentota bacterium]
MRTRTLIILAVLCVFSACLSSAFAAEKPNVVFIMTDQQRWDTLECYRTANGISDLQTILTPAIDSLASGGTLFSNAYVNCPQCMPSRATLYTGLHPTTHGYYWNKASLPFPENEVDKTIAWDFKRNGYKTACFGKMHISQRSAFDLGFGETPQSNFEDEEDVDAPNYDYFTWVKTQSGRTNSNRFQGVPFPGNDGNYDYPIEEHHEYAITDRAVQFIDDNASNPFFMWVSYFGPHTPLNNPEPYWSTLDPNDMPFPPLPPGGAGDDAPRQLHAGLADTQPSEAAPMTPAKWQLCKSQYYARVMFIDDMVQRIIDKLEANDLLDNTIIVFTADHGDMMGDHGLYTKGQYGYDGTTRIPMIIKAPGVSVPGAIEPGLTSQVDLVTTLYRLAGLPVPRRHQGKSLVPVMEGTVEKINDVIYSEIGPDPVNRIRIVVTEDYKYVHYGTSYKNGSEELFDRNADPREFTNLVPDSGYAVELSQMRQLKNDWVDYLDNWVDRSGYEADPDLETFLAPVQAWLILPILFIAFLFVTVRRMWRREDA